ncbi:hypothetical protein M8R78_22035, partial [Enterobacter hormaechei]|nr:hypothetical protein [Enterobacter hormaechei]
HGDVLMWLMKTLLTSGCTNQRGAGQWIGACNELTQDNLDPISRTPETKYCAVQMEAIEDQRWAEDFAASAYQTMKTRLIAAVNV